MKSILALLRPIVLLNLRHPKAVVTISITLAIVTAMLALKLKVDTDIANLLPKSYQSVQALERLQQTVGGEMDMQVALQSPSFEANKQFAVVVVDQATKLIKQRTSEP
jgi:predicted RND superfamily exporter protein